MHEVHLSNLVIGTGAVFIIAGVIWLFVSQLNRQQRSDDESAAS
jgi:hypothetical protein